MAPSVRSAAAAAAVAGGCLYAGSAFVAAPSAGAAGHLRATSLSAGAQALPAASPAPAAHSALGGLLLAAAGAGAAAGAAARRGARAGRHAAVEPWTADMLNNTDKAKELEFIKEGNIPRPEDLLESPAFPLFVGSTGGYMSRATRERHAITWTSKENTMIELPTAGMAVMNVGENLCYFRKKEQCIALGKQLRQLKINNYKIYRIAKDGTVTFMHPADGVFPEKVNKGRVQVNGRPFTVGQNPKPGSLKWTKYHMKSYEADPLTTLFVKARVAAFDDVENLFALPQPTGWVARDEKSL